MKKFLRQLSATTLALMLLSSNLPYTTVYDNVYADDTSTEGGSTEGGDTEGGGTEGGSTEGGDTEGGGTEGGGTEGGGTDGGGTSSETSSSTSSTTSSGDSSSGGTTTTTPTTPTVNTNFGTVTRSYYLNEASPTALTVTASTTDSGTLSYQWYKDGTAITGETSSSYTPSTTTSGTSTYYCDVTNTLSGTPKTYTTDSVSITILASTELDSTVSTPTISEQYSNYIAYELNRNPSDLVIQINASRIESDSITFQWYKSSINNTGSGTVVSSGSLSPYSITNISLTPDTSQTGSYYYYCVITNTKDGVRNSITSSVVNVTVSTHYNNNNYPNDQYYQGGTQISSNGTITMGSNAYLNIDRTSLQNHLNSGRNSLTIYGSNLQSVTLPATLNTSVPFTVTIVDSWDNINYTWKINDSSKVSSYLDLVVNTATSLSNVNQSYTNLNYDSLYSQVLQFNHDGSLNTNGATMNLQIPTTVSDGTVWLYKLSGKNILTGTELQASVSGGILYANMQSCSDWLISANKLMDVSSGNANQYYYNIKTDARLNIPQFQNVVIGGYVDLSSINTNFFTNYRFEGWYYDTAYQYPVTGPFLTSMLITDDIINNGIYPKLTYYNTHVPENSFPVPSTTVNYLAQLF